MKKISLIAAALAGLALFSCKKAYTCECVTSSDEPQFYSSTESYTTPRVRKNTAEDVCNLHEESYSYTEYDPKLNKTVTYTTKTECVVK